MDEIADMDEIAEQIFEKIEGINIKDNELYDYIDTRIDDWNIDIGNYYLDDIIDYVIKIKKLRKMIITKSNDDEIVFKMDDEMAEKQQLDVVVKKYNKLYKAACTIVTVDVMIESEFDCNDTKNEWSNTLNRIDAIYNKVKK